jgi:hypothetical protein
MLARLSRATFDRLVAVLANNPIFISKGRKPQRHVKVQLASFLLRYGDRGSNAFKVCRNLNIGEGTVFLYCRRVTRAIRQLRSKYLGWPDDPRKIEISNAIENRSGFYLCLGSGDGSLIRFAEEPLQFGYMFRCRKKFFAVCILCHCNFYLLMCWIRQIYKQLLIINYALHPSSWVGQVLSLTRRFGSSHIYGYIVTNISRMVNISLLIKVVTSEYVPEPKLMSSRLSNFPICDSPI